MATHESNPKPEHGGWTVIRHRRLLELPLSCISACCSNSLLQSMSHSCRQTSEMSEPRREAPSCAGAMIQHRWNNERRPAAREHAPPSGPALPPAAPAVVEAPRASGAEDKQAWKLLRRQWVPGASPVLSHSPLLINPSPSHCVFDAADSRTVLILSQTGA